MTMQPPRPEPYSLVELPEFATPRSLGNERQQEPVRVPIWARIIGWIVNIITGLAGG